MKIIQLTGEPKFQAKEKKLVWEKQAVQVPAWVEEHVPTWKKVVKPVWEKVWVPIAHESHGHGWDRK